MFLNANYENMNNEVSLIIPTFRRTFQKIGTHLSRRKQYFSNRIPNLSFSFGGCWRNRRYCCMTALVHNSLLLQITAISK